MFGAFVALASFLPRYYVGAYGLGLTVAGTLAGLHALLALLVSGLTIWMHISVRKLDRLTRAALTA